MVKKTADFTKFWQIEKKKKISQIGKNRVFFFRRLMNTFISQNVPIEHIPKCTLICGQHTGHFPLLPTEQTRKHVQLVFPQIQ